MGLERVERVGEDLVCETRDAGLTGYVLMASLSILI